MAWSGISCFSSNEHGGTLELRGNRKTKNTHTYDDEFYQGILKGDMRAPHSCG